MIFSPHRFEAIRRQPPVRQPPLRPLSASELKNNRNISFRLSWAFFTADDTSNHSRNILLGEFSRMRVLLRGSIL
jgi:hypothetical protein